MDKSKYIYVHQCNLDGSHKSQSHHHQHPSHYSSFYPEMIVPSTNEPVDLTAAAEFDEERQTIEKSLSKLSLPIVRNSNNMHRKKSTQLESLFRFKILKVEVH